MSTIERRENPHLVNVVSPEPFNIDYKVARALQPRDGPLWTDGVSSHDVRMQPTLDNHHIEILATFKGKGLIERTLNSPDVLYLAAVVNPESSPEEVLSLMAATQYPIQLISPERAKKGFALFLERVAQTDPSKGAKLRERYGNHLVITKEDGAASLALPLTEREFDLVIGLAAVTTKFLRP